MRHEHDHASFTRSRWLQNAMDTAMTRDPVDALNDAEELVTKLRANLEAIVTTAHPVPLGWAEVEA